MAKRGNGEGSISKRKDGTWRGQYTVGFDPKTGKIIRRSVYGKTRREVSEKLAERIADVRKGICHMSLDKSTLSEWLDVFLWDIKISVLKPKSFSSYEEDVTRNIKPYAISQMKMKNIYKVHMQQWVNALESDGRSPHVIKRAYDTLRCAFNEAVDQNIIALSPAKGVKRPKVQPEPMLIFSDDEQTVFFKAIKGHRLEALFILAITTGMREGELAALTWNDYSDGFISITKNVVYVPEYDEETRKKIGSILIEQNTPKTKAGTRAIPLMQVAKKALARHRLNQNIERMKKGPYYTDNNLIFCNRFGGLYDPKRFYKELKKILKANNLPDIRFHGLRHNFATWGLEHGVPEKAMQELLGHETPEMVLHYQHLRREHARNIINELETKLPR